MTRRRPRGLKGQAWNFQVFTNSMIARRGGPVQRSLASIARSSSKKSLYAKAKRDGWGIIRIGETWVLYDRRLLARQVLGPRLPRGSV